MFYFSSKVLNISLFPPAIYNYLTILHKSITLKESRKWNSILNFQNMKINGLQNLKVFCKALQIFLTSKYMQ